MQRASFASSSVVNNSAIAPSLAFATASSAAAAPLMSQAPRPIARSTVTRSTCGSADHAGESGTVSRCTLNRTFGSPRTACSATAPAPKSVTVTSKPGSCARR